MAGKVGFIGLGAMGGPMARNLIGAGTPLVVVDTLDEALGRLQVAPADFKPYPLRRTTV